MGKLRDRLHDASRSGVYRVRGDAEIRDALRGSKLALHAIPLEGDKKALLSRLAGALQFPQWFGANWDALEDLLKERGAEHVLVFSGAAPASELIDVLGSVADFWKGEGKPFFAVFVDPEARLAELPELFRQA